MMGQGGEEKRQSLLLWEAWLDAMIAIARHYTLPVSVEHVRNIMSWDKAESDEGCLSVMARHLGLGFRLESGEKAEGAVRSGVALPFIAHCALYPMGGSMIISSLIVPIGSAVWPWLIGDVSAKLLSPRFLSTFWLCLRLCFQCRFTIALCLPNQSQPYGFCFRA